MNIRNLKICLTIHMVIGHKVWISIPSFIVPPTPLDVLYFFISQVVKHVKGSHKVVKWRNPEAQGDKVYLAFFFINSLSKSKYRSYILMVSVFLQKWLRNVVSPRWEQSPKWCVCQSDQQFASVHRSGS